MSSGGGGVQLQTSVIGSFPKPDYLQEIQPDWFEKGRTIGDKDEGAYIANHNANLKNMTPEARAQKERIMHRAIEEVIRFQVSCGLTDVVTDGEVRRENYVNALCRNISGIQFEELKLYQLRGGACQSDLPTVVGKVAWKSTTGATSARNGSCYMTDSADEEDFKCLTNESDEVDVAAEWRVAQRIADKVAAEEMGGRKLHVK